MITTLVMTIIGPDRTGLVKLVATTLADNGANWLESRMVHLGGQFAGIVRAEVEADRAEAVMAAMRALDQEGLSVIVQAENAEARAGAGTAATLELVGNDRPGILRAVTAVLSAHGVNVEELSSERVAAPMGGGTLFQASIRVLAPSHEVLMQVRTDFEKIAADLMVDLQIHPAAGE